MASGDTHSNLSTRTKGSWRFWSEMKNHVQFHKKNKFNATDVFIKKFIFLQFVV